MKRKVAAVCAVLFCCVFAVSAIDLDFTIVNELGVDVVELYLSPHVSDDWEEDIMDGDVLVNGDYLDISVDETYTDKFWDILCVDEYGNEHVFNMVDLSKFKFLTMRWSDKKGAYLEKE